jgi:hypothetical protein
MYGKFYKSLIIGNPQLKIIFIPTRNDGIMEWWNGEKKHRNSIIWMKSNQDRCKKIPTSQYPIIPKSNIPLFQHSIIPANCERSELSL